MKRNTAAASSLLFVLLSVGACAATTPTPPSPALSRQEAAPLQILPDHPVCEASAATWAPCPGDEQARCALVADNERKKHVYRYQVGRDGSLQKAPAWEIVTGVEVEDAEGLTATKTGWLLLGSHGRKKSCKPDEKRLRIALLSLADGTLSGTLLSEATTEAWSKLVTNCRGGLLKHAVESTLKDEACRVIEDAERTADAEAKTPSMTDPCATTVPALNLEAITSAPDGRVWIGVRAPLLPDGSAMLLRLAPEMDSRATVFDGIASVALGTRGIRELTVADGWLYGIGGTALDGTTQSTLWAVPVAQLRDGARFGVEAVRTLSSTLPAGAEGLLVDRPAKRATVIVDGVGEKDATACTTPAQQLVVPLSDL